jgi:hypothetical protein
VKIERAGHSIKRKAKIKNGTTPSQAQENPRMA